MKIRLGTRGSALALWQARKVEALIKAASPGAETAIVIIRTKGDAVTGKPLHELGGTGVFVKELEKALLEDEIDAAVHSLKDMPLRTPAGLRLAACLEREWPGDAFVSARYADLASVPAGGRIGAGSLRRESQLRALRPDLSAAPLRGNVESRVAKLRTEGLDGIVIAAAGLSRLGMAAAIVERLPPELFTPAPGQGIIALETRDGTGEPGAPLARLDDAASRESYRLETAFLAETGGGCSLPVGALCLPRPGGFALHGYIGDREGRRVHRGSALLASGDTEGAAALAGRLLDAGGRTVLDELRAKR